MLDNPAPAEASFDVRLRKRIDELSQQFADSEEGRNVSDFWRRLVTKHLDLLGKEGFERFKQTLNFEYSQWCVSAPIDPKLWHMLYTFARTQGVPSVLREAKYQKGARLPRWPIPSPGAATVYKTFVSTLWEYARHHDKLGILDKVEEASLGTPIPLYYRGKLISQDLALSSLEINRAVQYLELSKIERVLEIGGGYGRLAYVLKKLLPNVEYHIVDIPPTLGVSELYLTTLFGSDNLHFHLPAKLKDLPAKHFDLVVNVSSFDEMNASQAHAYLAAFSEKGRGISYIKGHTHRDPSTGRRGIFELSYPENFRELYRGGDPFKASFGEMVFKVG
jgi:putative sugar O-methyltransferase